MSKKRRSKKTENKVRKASKNMEPKHSKASDIIQRYREQARLIYEEAKKSGKIGSVMEHARKLALEAKESDPNISSVYWFPHDEEVHLIMVDKNLTPSQESFVEPFYSDSTSTDPMPSGVAIIAPDDYRKLTTPSGWGDWDKAREVKKT